MNVRHHLPVAIIGAGPVGLAAAAHLVRRGQSMVIMEAGATAAHSVRLWAHTKMLTPWKYNVDPAARELLILSGWQEPSSEELPTGREWVERYLEPLAALRSIREHLVPRTTVTAVARMS